MKKKFSIHKYKKKLSTKIMLANYEYNFPPIICNELNTIANFFKNNSNKGDILFI